MGHDLDKILEKTINTLESSKKDIFSIAESSRNEIEKIEKSLKIVNQDINRIIDKIERLERENRRARIKLMEVSRDFKEHTEEEIRRVYERAEDTSVEIAVYQEKEEQLRARRNEFEERLINIKHTYEKADRLVSKVGIVRDYLQGELGDISEHYSDLKQKKNLAIKIIEAQEEERKRVAREIHDGPAQSMANLVFRVELTQNLIDKDLSRAKRELDNLKDMVRYSVRDVRKIIFDLRPMSLDDLGLIPTVKRYINKFMERTHLLIEFNVMGTVKRLPSSHEITIFRLIQEALNNVNKHADATQVNIRIEFVKKQLNLLIADNGKGFETGQVNEGRYGLINMQERCELINAKFNIKSCPNKGTKIQVKIPLKDIKFKED